jgi:hypothetical protein
MPDYIPASDEKFLEWAKNLYDYAATHFSGWNIPTPQTDLQTLLTAYETAFQVTQNPNRGKVDVLHKNEARDALKSKIRVYVRAYLINNLAVTDEDKAAMGLPIHKKGKTSIPLPETVPELTVDTGTPRRHKVHYRDKDSERRGKPAHVAGIEIRSVILDHYPASVDELVNSNYDTASPFVKDYNEAERGKKVYYCGRWEISKEGGKGPFGEIVEAIIP